MKSIFYFILFSILLKPCNADTLKSYDIKIKEKLILTLPDTFSELELNQIEEKYKSNSFRPNREFIETQQMISLSISYDSNPLEENGIEGLRQNYEKRFKELYPDANWIQSKTDTVNSLKVGIIETTDSALYQLIFFTSLDGKQVHFAIQGDKKIVDKIQPLSRKILHSLKMKEMKP